MPNEEHTAHTTQEDEEEISLLWACAALVVGIAAMVAVGYMMFTGPTYTAMFAETSESFESIEITDSNSAVMGDFVSGPEADVTLTDTGVENVDAVIVYHGGEQVDYTAVGTGERVAHVYLSLNYPDDRNEIAAVSGGSVVDGEYVGGTIIDRVRIKEKPTV